MGLAGILVGLALLIWLAFRGWSILLLAPAAACSFATIASPELLVSQQERKASSKGRLMP